MLVHCIGYMAEHNALCNAPGVRREASLTILFTIHKWRLFIQQPLTASASRTALRRPNKAEDTRPSWVTFNKTMSRG